MVVLICTDENKEWLIKVKVAREVHLLAITVTAVTL